MNESFQKDKQLNKATLGDNIELARQDLTCTMPMSQYNLCHLMEDSQRGANISYLQLKSVYRHLTSWVGIIQQHLT